MRGIETVYQEEALANDLSIERNLFLGREPIKSFGSLKFLDTRLMREKARETMVVLSLHVGSTQQEVQFCSGGERQGVAIARAICFKSRLVILDEPTRALAVAGIHRVLEFINELKQRDIACIFISHGLFHAYGVMDRIVILVRGRKVKDVPRAKTTFEELTESLLRPDVADE